MIPIDAILVREKLRLAWFIKKTREERGLSQLGLAKRMHITQGRVSQIETTPEEVSFDCLFDVLRALGFKMKIVVTKGPSSIG